MAVETPGSNSRQDLESETQLMENEKTPAESHIEKRRWMKKNDKTARGMDPGRVALLFGLSVGMGIVVHEGFFFSPAPLP